jgi:hypothetical protein
MRVRNGIIAEAGGTGIFSSVVNGKCKVIFLEWKE